MFGKYENINYMIVTQDLVCNSMLGLILLSACTAKQIVKKKGCAIEVKGVTEV